MPSRSIIFTSSTCLLLIALFSCSGEFAVLGQNADARECQTYTHANTTTATCNDVPGITCTGGCTGYVTAQKCTRDPKVNGQEATMTTEKCTVAFGRTSASMYICQSEHASFICFGTASGNASCKGCSIRNSTTSTNGTNMAPGASPTNHSSMGTSNTSTTGTTNTSPVGTSNNPSVGTTEGSSANPAPSGSGVFRSNPVCIIGANVLALLAVPFFSSSLL